MKKVSTKLGILIIIAAAVVLFGGVLAYQYFAMQKADNQNSFQNTTASTNCIPAGGMYGAPLTNADLCCSGLTQQPTSVSGTMGICVISATTNWKTYRNDKYGFEIKYPKEYKVSSNNPGDSFVAANLLQIYDPVDANQMSEFVPELTINIIRQPYVFNGKIYNNINEFANLKEWNRNKTIKFKNVIALGLITGLKIYGTDHSGIDTEYSAIETSFNEILVMLPNLEIISVDYPDKFSNIASTFKFTK